MIDFLKIGIKNFLGLNNNFEILTQNSDELLENLNYKEIEENINKKTEVKLITLLNLLYIISIISLIGLSYYLFINNFFDLSLNIKNIGHLKDLDNDGILLYKLSAELSKSSTVKSWDVIHKVLKDLDESSVNVLELITELEKLRKLNSLLPGDFSTNQDSFDKSLFKLINFLKEFL